MRPDAYIFLHWLSADSFDLLVRTKYYSAQRPKKAALEIRVPPVQDRSRYIMVGYDSRVECVVAEFQEESVMMYEVKKRDGQMDKVGLVDLAVKSL